MEAQELQTFADDNRDRASSTSGESGDVFTSSVTHVPLQEEPPEYRSPQHLPRYTPAPTAFLHAQPTTNTCVVNSQPTDQHHGSIRHPAPGLQAKTHMIFTVFFGCFVTLINPTGLFLLIPAIIFECLAIQQNNIGDYENARNFGMAAIICDVLLLTYSFVVLCFGACIAFILLFT